MITYKEKEHVFKLDTPNTTYMIGIVDDENFVGHIYYGRKLKDADAFYLMRTEEPPFVPSKIIGSAVHFTTVFRLNIRQVVWEITEKAVLAFGRQQDMWEVCFPMYRMRSKTANQSLRDFRRLLAQRKNV